MLSDKRLLTSLITIAADVALTLFRVLLAYFTGSSALMADAYHSVTDLSVSVIFLMCMLIKVWQDRTGNEKRISIARKIESMTVVLAALVILCIPYQIIMSTRQYASVDVENIWLGIFGVMFIILSVFAIARLKTYVGKKTGSLALEADGYHSMVDLFTSIAVLFSLIGLLLGIDIDELVAVIIALLIGLSGLELLVSGLKSLIKNEVLEQVSLFDTVKGWYTKDFAGKQVFESIKSRWQILTHYKYYMLIGGLTVYALSGFVQVSLGQQGIIQVLNKTVYIKEQPGLAYAPPWPLGQSILVANHEIKSVVIGSDVSDYTRRNGERMWFEIHANRADRDDSSYIQTGDHNLVFVQAELHYQLLPVEMKLFDSLSS